MKKVLSATAALITLGASMPALAADLPARTYTKAPAYAAMPIYNWTGVYIGGHIGGAFTGDNSFAGTSSDNNAQFLGGVQIGGDYQFAQNWVVGVEGQFSWLGNSNGVTFPGGFAYTSNQSGLGSVTGRIGYRWGPGLLYVKGGYAYSDYSDSLTLNGAPAAFALNGSHHDG
ncbi:outer membrane immunogenic protein [Bradyrhizobium sp. AZCC 2289]